MKYQIIRSDFEYRDAINYSDHLDLYNPPVTIEVRKTKWVLGVGSSDQLTVRIKQGIVYLIAENSGLDYISLTIIDTKNDTINEAFIGNGGLSDLTFKKSSIFEYSFWFKVNFLTQYL